MGQIRKTLKTMIGEHMTHIKRNTLQTSVITDWNMIMILIGQI